MIQRIDNKQKLFRFLKSWVYFWQNQLNPEEFNKTMAFLFGIERKYWKQDDMIHFEKNFHIAYRVFGSEVRRLEEICMSLLGEMEAGEKRMLMGKINRVYSSYKNLSEIEKVKNRVRRPTDWKEMRRTEKIIVLSQFFVGDKCMLVKLEGVGYVTIPKRIEWLLNEKDDVIIKSGKFSTCEKKRHKLIES